MYYTIVAMFDDTYYRILLLRCYRDGTAEPVSRDQILRHERGQGVFFPCSANHVQDWQPYPVDPFSCYMCDHTYIHTHGNVMFCNVH